jgi:hypothetical protein
VAGADDVADVDVTEAVPVEFDVPLAGITVGSAARLIEYTVAPMSKPRSAVLAIVFIDLPDLATWRPCTGYAGCSTYSDRFGKIGRAS